MSTEPAPYSPENPGNRDTPSPTHSPQRIIEPPYSPENPGNKDTPSPPHSPHYIIEPGLHQRQAPPNPIYNQTYAIVVPEPKTKPEPVPLIKVRENRIAVVAAFFLFSYLGVLIRIALNKWHTYDGSPASLAVYPQFVGCLIMGYLYEDKNRLETMSHTLYVGLTSALCGSITTFSGVMLMASEGFFNVADVDRKTINSVTAGFVVLLLGFGMSYVGFMLGRWIYEWIYDTFMKSKSEGKIQIVHINSFSIFTLTKADIVIIILAIAFIAALIPIAIVVNVQRGIIYSVIFAPAGSLIRRWLGFLNPKVPTFPIGTFIVNFVGSGILAILYLLPGVSTFNSTQCAIREGLMDGFCGCLTTVSTFVVELASMKRINRNIYGLGSVVSGQMLSVILFAAISWPKPFVIVCD